MEILVTGADEPVPLMRFVEEGMLVRAAVCADCKCRLQSAHDPKARPGHARAAGCQLPGSRRHRAPPIYDRPVEPALWYGSYVQTYLERDVRQLLGVRDLTLFQRFLRLTAGRTGQLLNQSALAEETGVSHNTVRKWLSVLEASYIIHRLPPHHNNFNKRLVKTPKLYMLDTGLASWLLGIESAQQIATHPLRGALFESWVVGEHLKARWNAGRPSNLYFWRDRAEREVDLVIERGGRLQPVEIKAGATVTRDALHGLERWCELAGDEAAAMHTVQIGEMKAHLSEILERIRTEGEEFVLEFGRGHEKVAVLVPYEKYRRQQRTALKPGLLQERASFAFREDSALRDEDLIGGA